jgi:hypothetical protein
MMKVIMNERWEKIRNDLLKEYGEEPAHDPVLEAACKRIDELETMMPHIAERVQVGESVVLTTYLEAMRSRIAELEALTTTKGRGLLGQLEEEQRYSTKLYELLEEVIDIGALDTDIWGKCLDYDPHCPTCRASKLREKITQALKN